VFRLRGGFFYADTLAKAVPNPKNALFVSF